MTPATNACGCPYTAYTITAKATGRRTGGPWCPSCGASLAAAEAGRNLVRRIRGRWFRIRTWWLSRVLDQIVKRRAE